MKGIFNIILALAVGVALSVSIYGLPLVGLWLFLLFFGAPAREQKARLKQETQLMPTEQIAEQAVQHRVFALLNRRLIIAITDSRILVMRRGLIGGYKMSDIQWKELRDVQIDENVLDGICGSNLTFKHALSPLPLVVNGVPSGIAAKIYSRGQAEEQAWEEKRRVRTMEEVRAAAGGVTVHNAPAQAASPQSGNRLIDEIQRAKDLLDAGTISDAEFQEMKAKILSAA